LCILLFYIQAVKALRVSDKHLDNAVKQYTTACANFSCNL
jgi:hypothetical protein